MKPVASAQDQEKPTGQTSENRQGKMVLIKRENKKSAKKSAGRKIPQTPVMTNSDPLLLNSPSTHGNVTLRIAERAYELWEQREGHHGQALDDWLAAERQVLAE